METIGWHKLFTVSAMTQTDYSGPPNRLADIIILEAKGGLLAVLGGHCLCEPLGIGGRQGLGCKLHWKV